MPIEIRELIIRATVDGQSPGRGSDNGPDSGKGMDVQEIAERVFAILKEKSER